MTQQTSLTKHDAHGASTADPATRPLCFAMIGCGNLARRRHLRNIARSPRLRLHTCCDLDESALTICREQFGAEHTTKDMREAIEHPDVEAVCVATTADLRKPIVAMAAEAGKPIYIEKPLANTMEECYDIQRIVNEAGIPFCIGHNRRSSPALLDANEIYRAHMKNPKPCPWRIDREGSNRPRLENDGVGAISIRINDDWYSWKGWAFNEQINPHGKILTEMTHFTDICNWFMAAEPEEVFAMKVDLFNASCIFRYATGEMATIVFSTNGSFGYPKELFEVFGHGGVVVIDHMVEMRTAGIEGAPHHRAYPLDNDTLPDVGKEGGLSGYLAKQRRLCDNVAQHGADPMSILECEADKGHANALERFADEIRGVGPTVNGIDDAILSTRMAFAAVRSAKENRPVKMNEV